MQYFIGIVPPKEYKERIVHFQKEWIGNLRVEPHITLKAQGGLTPDKKWLNKVVKVCENSKSFKISLNEPKFFGHHVLYLSANSNDLFDLHRSIVREVSPSKDLIKKYFELDDFVPHLTLGKTQYGITEQELVEMKNAAIQQLKPYPIFDVSFIRVYERNMDKQRYDKYLDIPLMSKIFIVKA